MRRSIVPPYLLSRIADDGERYDRPAAARAARRTLAETASLKEQRIASRRTPLATGTPGDGRRGAFAERGARPASSLAPERTISDAGGEERLPGGTVRREGQAPTGDSATDEAYDGLGATFAMLAEAFGRDSIDGRGLPLDATVHYGRGYDNAFWDGARMVFGDGDGEVFRRFTISLSVIGHELAHGVTQFTAGLEYEGQSGALNESVSDVFGVMVEQHARGQRVEEADWLIGAGLFTDEVQGRALRSMSAPGTAYDDDMLGRDPQPAHMDFLVETVDDNGGVHINSGIPNRAFHLAATAIGGTSWEGAGRVWYRALTSGKIPAKADFGLFAGITWATARELYGSSSREAEAVADAWRTVGVEPRHVSGKATDVTRLRETGTP